jgi:hypothetical protein
VKTSLGRVVYRRKFHPFNLNDLRRIAAKVDVVTENSEEIAKTLIVLWTLIFNCYSSLILQNSSTRAGFQMLLNDISAFLFKAVDYFGSVIEGLFEMVKDFFANLLGLARDWRE